MDNDGNIIKGKGVAGIRKRVMYPWPKHAVIHFDFKWIANKDSKVVKNRIIKKIYKIAKTYNKETKLEDPKSVTDMSSYLDDLFDILTTLGNGYESKVIVLIDEYDAIFRDSTFDSDLQKSNMKDLIQEFYNVLKDKADHIQLKLITGITTVSFTDIFTWSPDITNLSLGPQYSALVGFTKKEIEDTLNYEMFENLAKGITRHNPSRLPKNKTALVTFVMDRLEEWYNGYRFSDAETTVYNTLSIVESFCKNRIKNHWMNSLNSEIQFDEIWKYPKIFLKMQVDEEIREIPEVNLFQSPLITTGDEVRAIAVLYQTGLLTIKSEYELNGSSAYT
eukprot:GAHX01000047.1.p1 GENE.GAHX01000047.1~~GAHX01000047.1.p1  ORF type:complete len:334 (-),score=43.68 GAHX01000047.1:790-1791(-)